MRVGLISDTHGDLNAWQKALAGPFQGAELVLHAGDILYHGPKNPLAEGYGPKDLAAAINTAPMPVVFARGNCDSSVDQLVIDYPILSPYSFVQLGDLRVLISHGDEMPRDKLWAQLARYHAQILVFGHIHTPVLEVRNGLALVNPGSPSLPKSPTPTVGLLDTRAHSISIIDLDSAAVLQQAQL